MRPNKVLINCTIEMRYEINQQKLYVDKAGLMGLTDSCAIEVAEIQQRRSLFFPEKASVGAVE